MSDDAISSWRYLLLAVLTFMLLGADMVSVLVGKLLDGRALSDPLLWSNNWYATVGAHLCSITIWSVWVVVLLAWSKRRGILASLLHMQAGSRALLVLLVGTAVLAIIGWLEARTSGQGFPSVVWEYRSFVQVYGSKGLVVTVFQYLYYLLESAMVVALICLLQRAFERWTRMVRIPWGGIGLALTWGAVHLGTHPEGAVIVILIALLYGIAFTLAEKSAPATLALVFLGFVL